MLRNESGLSLLEVLIALTLLTVVGGSAALAVAEGLHTVGIVQQRDQELNEAVRLLDAVHLWSRDELDMRLGERQQGPLKLWIDRSSSTLYVMVVSDSLGTPILRTSVYRSEPPSEQ